MPEIKLVSPSDVKELRKTVFADEQGYPKEKLFDKYDDTADFLAFEDKGEIIGCGRFYKESENVYHIDNIAFSKAMRGKGFGKTFVMALADECRKNGAEKVTVNAQSYAVGFYEKCGFAVNGCELSDENRKIVPMEKTFIFDGCKYIQAENDMSAFFLRKNFYAENVSSAVVILNVMGFVQPFFNGEKLTDDMFIPVWSNYEKRDLSKVAYPIFDTMTQRRYYLEYDITEIIINGRNSLVLHIGDGWYGQFENNAEKMPKWGTPKAIFKIILRMNDGSVKEIVSDNTSVFNGSYVKHTNIYLNETIDGRYFDEFIFTADYDDSRWKNCNEVDVEPAIFSLQSFEGDRFIGSIVPELISENEQYRLYDLHDDVSGLWIVEFNDDAKTGEQATVSFAEKIDENGKFILRHTGGENRKQEDVYICGEKMREFSPIFTWRAGRYIKIKGNAFLKRFDVVYSPVKVTARLKTENKVLDWFFNAFCKTQNSNIHGMIPSDCPHRERLGYTGDGQLCSNAVMTVFDCEKMYRKWLDDIADCQDIYNGHIQHTAPMYGGGGGPGGWGGAIVIVPWNFYKKFGDISVLKKYYHRMIKYLDYMKSRCDDNIVVREEKDGWCLGDWCTPNNDIKIPNEYVNTYFYLKCIGLTIKSAEILGCNQDIQSLESDFFAVSKAFCDKFFNDETGSFCDGIQGADAFALDLGLGDERTESNLVAHYEKTEHLDTGIFGTDIVIRVLFEKGYGSLAWKMLTNENENSFGYMMNHGAITLWENWDGCDSLSHPMFGASVEYIFTQILGIQQTETSAGWNVIKIEPAYIPETGNISGSIVTPYGEISVSVSYCDDVQCVRFNIPKGIELCD